MRLTGPFLFVFCLLGGVLSASAQSSRPGWGSVPYNEAGTTGVTFRVWAPGATSVNVAGSFNGWSSSANALVLESATSGVWSVDVAAARIGNAYKYVMNGSLWRSDPRSRMIDSQDNNNSVVVSTNAFNWEEEWGGITNAGDLVIYEAHVGTFAGPSGTFSSFTNHLDDLRDLGVSGIELMPINEYPSATSWGYNPTYPFALEADYGTPDDLKRLVHQARGRGLAMILDVVHNHWDGGSSLWELDGTTPGPYFYANDPYAYTPWGPRPEYSRDEVKNYINDTFRMWLDEYHISAFRWDAPHHIIYTTNEIFIPDGLTMATNALSLMETNYPGAWNIAEDTKEITGFHSHWDLTFTWEIKSVLTQSDDNARDMVAVARNVAGTPDRILFTDSHDTAGDLNNGVRLPTAISSGNPTDYYARKRSALGAALVMTSPGTPMILQGQEMLETNSFSDTRAVDWTRTNSQSGTWRLYRDLIHLRRNLDGVSAGLMGDMVSTYQVDNVNKLIAYSRWDSAQTGTAVVVVANFANATRTNFAVQFPEAGTWYTLFNSDSTEYAVDYGDIGSLEVAASGLPASGAVDIAPYSVLILSQTPRSGMLIQETGSTDQPVGNGDGVLDPGETIQEQIVLWNKSQLAATNVSAVLRALTPGVTVGRGTSVYESMLPDASATNTTAFTYHLDPSLVCGSVLQFELATSFNGQVLTNVLDHVVGQIVKQSPVTNQFSVDVPTVIPDNATVYSDLTINEVDAPVISDIQVQIRINHTYDRDLALALQHPDGSEVLLVNRRGGNRNDFGTGDCGSAVYTVLDQSAADSIADGTAPFAGAYRPESTLELFNGKPLNGTWRLRMTDFESLDTGTNLCWSIRAITEQQSCSSTPFSNQVPVANATNLVLAPDATTNFFLTGSDSEGQSLIFEARAEALHGLFTLLSASSGESIYRPVAGYAGTDTVDFAVSDGVLTSETATVSFVVQPPEDANTNGLPDDWELAYYTNLNVALPEGDSDGDGMSNLEEALAQTHPQDSNSVLRLTRLLSGEGMTLNWDSVGGTRYRLEVSDSLDPAQFLPVVRSLSEEIDPAATGEASSQSFIDAYTNPPPPAAAYWMRVYRIRVLNE